MKKISLLITLFFFLSGIIAEVRASHAAGGEIIYEWVSGSTYRVTFKFYRDCVGIPAPTSQIVCAYNTCTNTNLLNTNGHNYAYPPQYYPGTNVPNGSPVSVGCPGYPTVCNGGTLPGYEEWWYVCEFNLPSQCSNWTFYTSISARNAQIDNLGPTPNGLNLFIYATLNNLVAQGNNSAVFTVKPVPYTCVNMPFTYNNGAIDPDGDSLAFEFVYPSDGPASVCTNPATTPIIFAPTSGTNLFNNVNNPFSTNGSFTFNTSTGEMSFTPTMQSENVVTVKVHEYRNGVEIGTVLRDIQLNIRPCNVPTPDVQIDTNSITASYNNGVIEVCVGNPLHFCFDAMTDPNRILMLSDNHQYISNNITVNYQNQGTDTVTGCFDWMPALADTGLHLFIVLVKDSTCDLSGIMVTNTLTVPIRVWPGIDITLQGDSVVCPGQSASMFAVGGGQSYQWTALPGGSGTGSINCLTCDSVIVTPTVTTTYAVSSASSFGCPDTSLMTIYVTPAPVASAGNDTTACGSQLQLQGSGGGNYQWFPSTGLNNANIANPIYTGTGTTTFTLVVTNTGSSCSDTDQVVVTLNTQPVANAGPDVTNCTNTLVQLNGSGGTTYSWTPTSVLNNSTIANPTMTVTDTTITFTLIVSNGQCSDTDQVTVSVHQAVANANAGPDTSVCAGVPVQLQGSGGIIYSWYPGTGLNNVNISNPVFSGSNSSTINLVVADQYGCHDTDQVVVTVNPQPVANAGPDVINCTNTLVQLNGSGGNIYNWTPTSVLNNSTIANPTMTVTDTTITFTLIVSNGQGCSDTDQVTISVHQAVATANAGPDTSVCTGVPVQLQGSGGIIYNWYPGTGLNNVNISNPVFSGSNSSMINLVVADQYGCHDTDQVVITVSPHPVANAGPDVIECTNTPVQLNGSGGGTYSWTPGWALNSTTIPNPDMTVTDTTITFIMIAPNLQGCSDTDQVVISVHQAVAAANAGPDTSVCPDVPLQLQGSGGITFNWYPATGLDNANIFNPVFSGGSNSTINLVVADQYGCLDTDQVVISMLPQLLADAGADQLVCIATPVTLQASGGTNYTWYPTTGMTGSNTANPTVNINEAITYSVIVSGGAGCPDTDMVVISVIPVPDFQVTPQSNICEGDSLVLNASGGNSYTWYPDTEISATDVNTVTVWPTTNATYYVIMTESQCGYSDTQMVQIDVRKAVIEITKATPIGCGHVYGQLEATGATQYVWTPAGSLSDPNIANPASLATVPTWYTVVGTDQYGCVGTDSALIQVIDDNMGGLYVPTAFTPNNDGKNDCYRILLPLGITDFELHIYNRFGNRVFTTTDPTDCWDGNYKGRLCDVGTYYYYYKLKSPACGMEMDGKGDITLIR